jgi:hypothetical protein
MSDTDKIAGQIGLGTLCKAMPYFLVYVSNEHLQGDLEDWLEALGQVSKQEETYEKPRVSSSVQPYTATTPPLQNSRDDSRAQALLDRMLERLPDVADKVRAVSARRRPLLCKIPWMTVDRLRREEQSKRVQYLASRGSGRVQREKKERLEGSCW